MRAAGALWRKVQIRVKSGFVTFLCLLFCIISKDGAHVNMLSPTEDFKARAHAGEFDTLTDDQYYKTEADAEEAASFWDCQSTPSGISI